jgi:hypothetical protein
MKIVISYETHDEGLIWVYRDREKRESVVVPTLIKQLRLEPDEVATLTVEGIE